MLHELYDVTIHQQTINTALGPQGSHEEPEWSSPEIGIDVSQAYDPHEAYPP